MTNPLPLVNPAVFAVWFGLVFSGVGFFVCLWVLVALFSCVSFEFVVDGGV